MKLVLPLQPKLDSLVAASLLCRYVNKSFVTQGDIQFIKDPEMHKCSTAIEAALLFPSKSGFTCVLRILSHAYPWKEHELAALRKCNPTEKSPVIDHLSFFLDALWFEYESTGAFSPTDLAYQVWCAFYQHFNSVVLPYLIHLEQSKPLPKS